MGEERGRGEGAAARGRTTKERRSGNGEGSERGKLGANLERANGGRLLFAPQRCT